MSKFLTKLTQPKLWDGYPFLLSAIVGDLEDSLILVLDGYDSAGNLVDSNESTPEAFTDSIVSFNVNEIYGSFTGVSYLIARIKSNLEEILTDDLRIDVVSPCDNPVYLLGRDSLGGCLQWMFDANQDLGFDYGNDIKAGRSVLFTQNINFNEWTCLQDFIRLGQVYRNNIVEFDSSVIKTSTRIGQQVYVVGADGNKIGVVVIPTRNKTQSKLVRHEFELEIEYPEEFTV